MKKTAMSSGRPEHLCSVVFPQKNVLHPITLLAFFLKEKRSLKYLFSFENSHCGGERLSLPLHHLIGIQILCVSTTLKEKIG